MDTKKARNLDQERATFAWKKVLEVKKGLEGKYEKYVNLSKSAPALVMNNGLMQALAFFQGKQEEHKSLCSHVCEWVGKQIFKLERSGFNTLMEKLHEANPQDYRRATEEALALLRWIRQFASAL